MSSRFLLRCVITVVDEGKARVNYHTYNVKSFNTDTSKMPRSSHNLVNKDTLPLITSYKGVDSE